MPTAAATATAAATRARAKSRAQAAASVRLGDCLEGLAEIPTGSADAVVTDPPYPEVSRAYGRMSEAAWLDMMASVVAECRRILKPSGSAVVIIQPNSTKVGAMRLWPWEFLLASARAWGLVQDAYWWNTTALPTAGACTAGLMRSSMKLAVWLGSPDCYRDQRSVLWTESQSNHAARMAGRAGRTSRPSGATVDLQTITAAAELRGGVTPFNVMPCAGVHWTTSAQADAHPAMTPLPLMAWWVRYLCPPGGLVVDPFTGSGTCGLAALAQGRRFLGIERDPKHHATATRRLADLGSPSSTVPRLGPSPRFTA